MFLFILFILIWSALTTLASIFIHSSWYILLWVLCSFIATALLYIIAILILVLRYKLDKNHKSRWKYKALYRWLTFVMIICRVKIEVIGKENIPTTPFISVANHKSMLDVVAIFNAYHTMLSAVSKKSVYNVPFVKHIMKSCAVVSIDRDNDREGVKELLKGIKLVEDGFNYIIFPEGGIKTRETEEMVSVRPGAYKLATKAGASISPVSIIGSSKIANNAPFKKTKVKIIIHKPIFKEEYELLNTTEIGDKIFDIVNEGIRTGKSNV